MPPSPYDDWGSDSTSPAGPPADEFSDADYSLLMDYPGDVDYYALLGLARNPPPTDAEIRSAYRNLTLSFHPDKQPSNLREAAEQHFNRIREAYETLIDTNKRTVYDLLGAEAVQAEWGAGGTMGRGGEAERQLGTKALDPQEFRRWFLEKMKTRERKAVNSLVQSKGSITLGIDASSMISVEGEDVYVSIPSPKASSYAVGYSFRTPLPIPRLLCNEGDVTDEDSPVEDASAGDKNQASEKADNIEMVISAGISGQVQHLKQEIEVTYEEGETEMTRISLPPILATKQLTLGASVSHNFADIAGTKGIFNRRPFSFLADARFAVNALALPVPTLETVVSKIITPIPGTKPFNVNLTTTFFRSPLKSPPTVGLEISKQVGKRKHVFCSWSSGTITWPLVLQELLYPIIPLGMDIETALAAQNKPNESNLRIGLVSVAERTKSAVELEDDEDEEDPEYTEAKNKERAQNNAAEAWQVQVDASPAGGGVSCTYSRNIFSGKAADEIVRSEWSSEGHYALPPASEPRSVRLEVQTTVGFNLALAWSIAGTRQVGDFTRMGFGIGIQGEKGLVMTVSWSRLGQKIKLPIAVCPLESVNADTAALAVVFPWLAYCAVEFGIIRPRERKKRRLAIAKRQKELRKLIPKKRAESLQAIELMADQVHRRQAREENHGGLVVTKAEYGYTPPANKKINRSAAESKIIDVTIPVAALVDHGQLVIPGNMAKFQILGFYDPAPLLPKTLKVWYTFNGKEHFVEANESQGIACPMRSHLLG